MQIAVHASVQERALIAVALDGSSRSQLALRKPSRAEIAQRCAEELRFLFDESDCEVQQSPRVNATPTCMLTMPLSCQRRIATVERVP